MTDLLSIGLTKLLRTAQLEEDGDCVREGMRVFSEAVMELEVNPARRRGAARAHGGAHRARQWLPRTALGYARRHD